MEPTNPGGTNFLNSLKRSDIEVTEVTNDQIALLNLFEEPWTESAVLGAGFHFAAIDKLPALEIHNQIEFRAGRFTAVVGHPCSAGSFCDSSKSAWSPAPTPGEISSAQR